jgi:hypothetical protein
MLTNYREQLCRTQPHPDRLAGIVADGALAELRAILPGRVNWPS